MPEGDYIKPIFFLPDMGEKIPAAYLGDENGWCWVYLPSNQRVYAALSETVLEHQGERLFFQHDRMRKVSTVLECYESGDFSIFYDAADPEGMIARLKAWLLIL